MLFSFHLRSQPTSVNCEIKEIEREHKETRGRKVKRRTTRKKRTLLTDEPSSSQRSTGKQGNPGHKSNPRSHGLSNRNCHPVGGRWLNLYQIVTSLVATHLNERGVSLVPVPTHKVPGSTQIEDIGTTNFGGGSYHEYDEFWKEVYVSSS